MGRRNTQRLTHGFRWFFRTNFSPINNDSNLVEIFPKIFQGTLNRTSGTPRKRLSLDALQLRLQLWIRLKKHLSSLHIWLHFVWWLSKLEKPRRDGKRLVTLRVLATLTRLPCPQTELRYYSENSATLQLVSIIRIVQSLVQVVDFSTVSQSQIIMLRFLTCFALISTCLAFRCVCVGVLRGTVHNAHCV